jgi:hypothetical protein
MIIIQTRNQKWTLCVCRHFIHSFWIRRSIRSSDAAITKKRPQQQERNGADFIIATCLKICVCIVHFIHNSCCCATKRHHLFMLLLWVGLLAAFFPLTFSFSVYSYKWHVISPQNVCRVATVLTFRRRMHMMGWMSNECRKVLLSRHRGLVWAKFKCTSNGSERRMTLCSFMTSWDVWPWYDAPVSEVSSHPHSSSVDIRTSQY